MTSPAPRPAATARSPEVRRTLSIVLALNLIVVAVKVAVGVRTSSLSVLGAALESGLDTLNNVIGMALTAVAARAPDDDHPYGHDKFETLGALVIVGFLSISCFELLREGVLQLVHRSVPREPSAAEIGLLLLTIGVNAVVVAYELRRGRELRSAFLVADAAHTGSDIYVTLVAIGSLLLARSGLGILDPILAIGVALVIAWNGFTILRDTVPVLVDERGVDAAEVRRLIAAIPEIADVRNVRSRSTSSGLVFAEVSIGVAAGMTVERAHELADAVEACLTAALGAAEVTVHVEPA